MPSDALAWKASDWPIGGHANAVSGGILDILPYMRLAIPAER